jgi:S-adenosylmethionine-dependent methyltransferase
MTKHVADEDRNFDDLAKRFRENVYGGLKGEIRLAVLRRDFYAITPCPFNNVDARSKSLRILDAGGGQGQFSLQFAEAGHDLVICDISSEMLKLAAQVVEQKKLQDRVTLIHCSINDLIKILPLGKAGFDIVLCHAVVEWMADPESLLPCLMQYLNSSGYLSFTYYNINSLIYKNLLRTNFKKVIRQDFGGSRGSLTPLNPVSPELVELWLGALPLGVISRSGIRVFHDYIFDEANRNREPENLIALELQYSRQQPFLSLGRYIHVLATKN